MLLGSSEWGPGSSQGALEVRGDFVLGDGGQDTLEPRVLG